MSFNEENVIALLEEALMLAESTKPDVAKADKAFKGRISSLLTKTRMFGEPAAKKEEAVKDPGVPQKAECAVCGLEREGQFSRTHFKCDSCIGHNATRLPYGKNKHDVPSCRWAPEFAFAPKVPNYEKVVRQLEGEDVDAAPYPVDGLPAVEISRPFSVDSEARGVQGLADFKAKLSVPSPDVDATANATASDTPVSESRGAADADTKEGGTTTNLNDDDGGEDEVSALRAASNATNDGDSRAPCGEMSDIPQLVMETDPEHGADGPLHHLKSQQQDVSQRRLRNRRSFIEHARSLRTTEPVKKVRYLVFRTELKPGMAERAKALTLLHHPSFLYNFTLTTDEQRGVLNIISENCVQLDALGVCCNNDEEDDGIPATEVPSGYVQSGAFHGMPEHPPSAEPGSGNASPGHGSMARQPSQSQTDFELVRQVTCAAIHALVFLKKKDLAHGDMRLHNFHIDVHRAIKIRLAPFGLSPLPPPFRPPECDLPDYDVDHIDAIRARDIFVLGRTLCLLAFGSLEPPESLPDLLSPTGGNTDDHDHLVDMLLGMLAHDPAQRHTMETANISDFVVRARVVGGAAVETLECHVQPTDTPSLKPAEKKRVHFHAPEAGPAQTAAADALSDFFHSTGRLGFQVIRSPTYLSLYSVEKDPRRRALGLQRSSTFAQSAAFGVASTMSRSDFFSGNNSTSTATVAGSAAPSPSLPMHGSPTPDLGRSSRPRVATILEP